MANVVKSTPDSHTVLALDNKIIPRTPPPGRPKELSYAPPPESIPK